MLGCQGQRKMHSVEKEKNDHGPEHTISYLDYAIVYKHRLR